MASKQEHEKMLAALRMPVLAPSEAILKSKRLRAGDGPLRFIEESQHGKSRKCSYCGEPLPYKHSEYNMHHAKAWKSGRAPVPVRTYCSCSKRRHKGKSKLRPVYKAEERTAKKLVEVTEIRCVVCGEWAENLTKARKFTCSAECSKELPKFYGRRKVPPYGIFVKRVKVKENVSYPRIVWRWQ